MTFSSQRAVSKEAAEVAGALSALVPVSSAQNLGQTVSLLHLLVYAQKLSCYSTDSLNEYGRCQ